MFPKLIPSTLLCLLSACGLPAGEIGSPEGPLLGGAAPGGSAAGGDADSGRDADDSGNRIIGGDQFVGRAGDAIVDDAATGDSTGQPLGDSVAYPDGDADGGDPSQPVGDPSPAGCPPIVFGGIPVVIGGGAGTEPSGADWHAGSQKLFVASDNGLVLFMNADGSGFGQWTIDGDLEGVTITHPASAFVYVGVEEPDGILEVDASSGTVRRRFDLTTWMLGDPKAGLEALTFVRDRESTEGGLFYAGHQDEGAVYVFELPIVSSAGSTAVRYVDTLVPVPGRTDLAGLDYDPLRNLVHVLYDSPNRLVTMTRGGRVVSDVAVPYNDQEGIAQSDDCSVFVAEDTGAIRQYAN